MLICQVRKIMVDGKIFLMKLQFTYIHSHNLIKYKIKHFIIVL